MECSWCEEPFEPTVRRSDGATNRYQEYCSRKCNNAAFRRRRRLHHTVRLAQLKADRGGECERCGYDECPEALCFHHRDPSDKLFELSGEGRDKSDEEVSAEADKCDMLCACCHIFIHKGLRRLIQTEQKEGV